MKDNIAGRRGVPSILIVDDMPANLELLSGMLKDSHYKIRAALSGELALQSARNEPPELILLDINMPAMDGYEVCRRLKADAELKDIPVIFLSALSEPMDKVKAFGVGGVDYVTKPFQFEEVFARVETHLRLRRMQLELERHNLHLEDLVKEQVAEISDSQLAAIIALTKLAESRDDATGAHIERTRNFARALAKKMREDAGHTGSITESFIESIYHTASLHDIGKVGILDSILLKPGKLTPEELEIMKTHSVIGANTLRTARGKYPRSGFLNMGIDIARSHHEKWDGSGYPEGLAGEAIPLAARIMAVADVYDALRAERPYKPAFSHEKSSGIILKNSGTHFDPAVIAAFRGIESDFAGIFGGTEANAPGPKENSHE
ncbi:MAG: response regulator [Elusimicrobiales bacterium]|nr:response regulator [Elusimicrobiales bacterium]